MAADAAPAADTAPAALARLLPLPPGIFAVTLEGDADAAAGESGLKLPLIQLCAAPGGAGAVEVVDNGGRPREWLGARDMLFFRVNDPGGSVLVTAYFQRGAGRLLPSLRLRPVAPPGPAAAVALASGPPAAASAGPAAVSLEVVAHVRGRGETRSLDPEWIGPAAPSSEEVIEAIIVAPRDPAAAGALEYKGLMEGGAETPWLAAGTLCGVPGGGAALLGLAVRQKPADRTGLRLDCEYSGRFRSGATAGPERNGAPCRSPAAADPLVGIRLRIAARRPDPLP